MYDFLLSCPAAFKLLGSLAVILILNALRLPLLLSVFFGSLVLALSAGHGFLGSGDLFLHTLGEADTLFLLLIVFLVIGFSNQMSETGMMKELVEVVRGKLSHRHAPAVLPAVIGMLPMPGGALFSAPMVAGCDPDGCLGARLKAQINYWFRHLWEYWWPMYPGVLLAVALSGLDVGWFAVACMPLTLFAILGGRLFLLRKIPRESAADVPTLKNAGRRFLLLVSPILTVVAVYALLAFTTPVVREANRYLPLCGGILAAAAYLQALRPLDRNRLGKALFNRKMLMLVLTVAAVMCYGGAVKAAPPAVAGGQSVKLVAQMAGELHDWGVPVLLVTALLPFLTGMTMGLAVGFVGASFPVVFQLLPPNAPLSLRISFTVLAYGFGYVGMMLSPVHVCFMVTSEYFETPLVSCYKRLLGPAAVSAAGTLLVSWLWGWNGA